MSGSAKGNSVSAKLFDFVYSLIGLTTGPLVDACVRISGRYPRVKSLPNQLVLFRLFLAWLPGFLIAAGILSHDWAFLCMALLVIVLLAWTDALDGRIARALGTDHLPWGKKWDPIADKALSLITIGVLAYLVCASPLITFLGKASVTAGSICYFLVELYLLVGNNLLARFKGKPMPGSNKYGKSKFTLVFVAMLVWPIALYLVSRGALDPNIFAVIVTSFLVIATILGALGAFVYLEYFFGPE